MTRFFFWFIFIISVSGIFLTVLFINQGGKFLPENKKMPKNIPQSIYGAWIPAWDQDRVLYSLATSSGKLKTISPVWYTIDQNKNITLLSKQKKNEIQQIALKNRIKIIPTISNEFDRKRVIDLFSDKTAYQKSLGDLINIAKKENYAGWDIDFEEFNLEDKDIFSKYINDLARIFHENKLKLSVSVHAQSGNSSDRAAARAQDLPKLAKSADYIRVMVYDYHNAKTEAGPVTPIDKYKEVLEYVSNIIPQEKLVIGLPLYGYDWGNNNNFSVEYQEAQDVIKKFNGVFIRDATSYELVGNYSGRVIWIEDTESIIFKINIAREYGAYQFYFWRLGGEDYELWNKL